MDASRRRRGFETWRLSGHGTPRRRGDAADRPRKLRVAVDGTHTSQAMARALQVLGGHLAWVGLGALVLAIAPVLRFRGGRLEKDESQRAWGTGAYRLSLDGDWAWWVAGGYFVSALLFNVADGLNHFFVPEHLFDDETLVTQMVDAFEGRGALAVGSIAPCITAPWWEEVLYRGFLLRALAAFGGSKRAVAASSVLFAAHHLTLTAALPLAVLGATWAHLYLASGNLLVPVAIHALWNARVFFGAAFGM